MSTRRTFLLSGCGAAFATVTAASTPPPTFTPTLPSPVPSRGPSLGLTLPLTGVQSEIANDLLDGYRLAAQAHGNAFGLTVLDDHSTPDKTLANVQALSKMPNVLALSGIVGTPHAQAGLPAAVDAGLPVVGIRSGAESLRKGQAGVFHYRSTYEAELERLATIIAGSGSQRVEVLFSDDSFGKGSAATFTAKLKELRVGHGEPISMSRNGENLEQAVDELAARTKQGGFVSIVMLVIADPLIRATERLRVKHKIALPVYAMSHVVNRRVASDTIPALKGLGVMLAFRPPRHSPMLMARMYRDVCQRAGKAELIESMACYEGFFYGSTFAQALKESGGASSSRGKLAQQLRQGVAVGELDLSPNARNEGYSFIELAYKRGDSGRLEL